MKHLFKRELNSNFLFLIQIIIRCIDKQWFNAYLVSCWGKRILNPESNEVFHPKDLVWIVGSERRIKIISQAKAKNKL